MYWVSFWELHVMLCCLGPASLEWGLKEAGALLSGQKVKSRGCSIRHCSGCGPGPPNAEPCL